MSTTIPCEVDTSPMAAELHSVSHHVNATTAAVVTMQSAVIAAENNGANKVCTNVNRGFFTLMRSQISAKIANKQSRVEALIMKLGQQKRLLLGIKSNMEREYGRIAERYLKIFTTINKELETRIRQIDQPVFELVNKHMCANSNRMHSLSGWATTSQAEAVARSQQILVSNLKHNAQVALEQSTDFLSQIGEQRVLTGKVLISNPDGNEDKSYNVPVLIMESVNDSAGIPYVDVRIPKHFSSAEAGLIENTVRGSLSMAWKSKGSSQPLTQEFSSLLHSSDSSERVKGMIQKMFDSSDFEIL